MAPAVPRFHLFEFNDQPWLPNFIRGKVQAGLTLAWITKLPIIQSASPASIVARVLDSQLGASIRDYVFIDFCAGAGGPTAYIEKRLNQRLGESKSASNGSGATGSRKGKPGPKSGPGSYAAVAALGTPAENGSSGSGGGSNSSPSTGSNGATPVASTLEPVRFVLTDLYPHEENWRKVAARSPNVTYVAESVDAANVPAELVARYKNDGKKVFRLFNLAFHHFDDPLARLILKNTVETSDGFGIFELQDRSFSSFLSCCILGIAAFLFAPVYSWKWRSPATLFLGWFIPVIPFILTFDGWISSLRTRTPEEVEALLKSCGAEGGPAELSRWEIKSGSETHLWPLSSVNWIVCTRR
ncbi:hypothetical protein VTK73DRAFT_1403 [Phialemonium thermophilum]|uniref:Uncharacterized protein n=1 Tax=Phialemonium thermophilum TaxID=223376 RepID=A0ABR3X9J3_9PEZI